MSQLVWLVTDSGDGAGPGTEESGQTSKGVSLFGKRRRNAENELTWITVKRRVWGIFLTREKRIQKTKQ